MGLAIIVTGEVTWDSHVHRVFEGAGFTGLSEILTDVSSVGLIILVGVAVRVSILGVSYVLAETAGDGVRGGLKSESDVSFR